MGKQIYLGINVSTAVRYSSREFAMELPIADYNPDWQRTVDEVKASAKLGFLGPQVMATLLQTCLTTCNRLNEVLRTPESASSGESTDHTVKVKMYADGSGYSKDEIGEVSFAVSAPGDAGLDKEAAGKLFTEICDVARGELLALLQANGVVDFPPPLVDFETALQTHRIRMAAINADSATAALADLRYCRERLTAQSAALKDEMAKASEADLDALAALGVDFTAAKQAVEAAAELAAERMKVYTPAEPEEAPEAAEEPEADSE